MESPAHMQITSSVTNLNIHNFFLIIPVIACLNFPHLFWRAWSTLPGFITDLTLRWNKPLFKLETFRANRMISQYSNNIVLISFVSCLLCFRVFVLLHVNDIMVNGLTHIFIAIFPVHIELIWIQTWGLLMSLKDAFKPTLFLQLTLSPASKENVCYHVTAVNVPPVRSVKCTEIQCMLLRYHSVK